MPKTCLLAIALAVAGCYRDATPCEIHDPNQLPELPSMHSLRPDPLGARVTRLAPSYHVPIVNRQANLVAGYFDAWSDGAVRDAFVVKTADNEIVLTDADLAPGADPPAREVAVNLWLARADWRQMWTATKIGTAKQVVPHDIWRFAALRWLAVSPRAATVNVSFVREADHALVGRSPWDPAITGADVHLGSLAYDPVSRLTCATWVVDPGASIPTTTVFVLADRTTAEKLGARPTAVDWMLVGDDR